ncbi:MAG: CDP-archaeol synthase, partial [Clostridia bacterium]|nr:CDP-archaeol synthase [Clostridia bacterium]
AVDADPAAVRSEVEGLIGGIISAILFSLLAAWIYAAILQGEAGVSYFEVFVLALICAPLSVVGDLLASWVKRRYGVKDFGNIFPGHGGMMDRFDSLLLVFPVFFAVVQMFPLIYSL